MFYLPGWYDYHEEWNDNTFFHNVCEDVPQKKLMSVRVLNRKLLRVRHRVGG